MPTHYWVGLPASQENRGLKCPLFARCRQGSEPLKA